MPVLMRLRRTLGGLDSQVVDAGIAGLLFAAVVGIGRLDSQPLGLVGVVSAGLTVASVAWRRRWPVVAMGEALAAGQWFRFHAAGAVTAVVSMAIVLDYYELGLQAASRWWRSWQMLLVAAAIGVIASGPGHWDGPTVASVWAFTVVLPFAAGRVVDARIRLTAQLEEEAALAEAAGLRRQATAAAEERTRIARDIHDVLAHSLSVMVIQTAAARRAPSGDTIAARQAMANVERCGREALDDLKRMVGMVHRDEGPPHDNGVAQLVSLADNARSAGLPVVLLVTGQDRLLSPRASLAVYRIVQEALTNCLKHAGASTATVAVTITDNEAVVRVVDDGERPPNGISENGAGHGLIGMRERASLCGGSFEAGPLPDRGFGVQATIPIGTDTSV